MRIFLKIIIPLAIIGLAFLGFKILAASKPEPKSKQPPVVIPIVELLTISPENHQPPVRSYGVIQAYFETELSPQVTGAIIEVSDQFRVGEMIENGHVLVKIDPTDYEAELAQRESALTVAKRAFFEEEIRAEQAKGDWEASGRDLAKASEFVLRKPQLAAAKADMAAAEAMIAKAKADVERTQVRAPFDAMIASRNASPGNQASSQVSLGRLIAKGKAEIRLPLTAEQFSRIKLPANATVSSPLKLEHEWDAKIRRVDPTIDSQNQVVYVIAEISDPFEKSESALSIGMFVNAEIEAVAIESSYLIPEEAFVQDQFMWAMGDEGKLISVPAQRIFSANKDVYVRLKDEEKMGETLRIITRPLSNFRSGMKVQSADAAE